MKVIFGKNLILNLLNENELMILLKEKFKSERGE